MAGIWQGARFWRNKLRAEDQPYRTSGQDGRRGCLGGPGDPFPGTYHTKNCKGKRINQRY